MEVGRSISNLLSPHAALMTIEGNAITIRIWYGSCCCSSMFSSVSGMTQYNNDLKAIQWQFWLVIINPYYDHSYCNQVSSPSHGHPFVIAVWYCAGTDFFW